MTAPPSVSYVEEVFENRLPLLSLHVGGQVIRTTAEHPFYIRGKGWVATRELEPGNLFRSHDGQWVPVQEVVDNGEESVVYNLRISEYHTYFVGGSDWGFSVWAHNACVGRLTAGEKATVRDLANDGVPVRDAVLQVKANRTPPEVEALYSNSNNNNKVYYDRNGKTSTLAGEDFGLMAKGNLHAETGVMANAYVEGIRGGQGTLLVDTTALSADVICGWCKTDIKTMARLQQLDQLTVIHISRQGTTTYVFPGEGLRTIPEGGMSWKSARQ